MASGVEGDPDSDGGRGVGVPHTSGDLLLGRQGVLPTSDKLDASCDLKSCPVSCPKQIQVDIHCVLLQSMMRGGGKLSGVSLSYAFYLTMGESPVDGEEGLCCLVRYLIVKGGG